MASWYLLEQADTEWLCSSALLVLSWLPPFPSLVLFPPTSISSSLFTPLTELSPDLKLLLESFLTFFLEYYGSLSRSEKCLLHRAEKAEGSVQPSSCYTRRLPQRPLCLRSFIFFSENQAPAIASHSNQCQAHKGNCNIWHLSRNPPIYMGKAPGSIQLRALLAAGQKPSVYLAFSSLGARCLSPDAAPFT